MAAHTQKTGAAKAFSRALLTGLFLLTASQAATAGAESHRISIDLPNADAERGRLDSLRVYTVDGCLAVGEQHVNVEHGDSFSVTHIYDFLNERYFSGIQGIDDTDGKLHDPVAFDDLGAKQKERIDLMRPKMPAYCR